jgi:rhodanese-related sulfurtransferase
MSLIERPWNYNRMMLFSGLVITLLMLTSAPLLARGVPTPSSIAGGRIITAEEALDMHKGKALFVDVRNPINFGRGHIPDAVSYPYKGKSGNRQDFDALSDKFDVTRLPIGNNTRVVFYSHGVTGWKSYKAAVTTIKSGQGEVFWFREGYSGWEDRGYSIER